MQVVLPLSRLMILKILTFIAACNKLHAIKYLFIVIIIFDKEIFAECLIARRVSDHLQSFKYSRRSLLVMLVMFDCIRIENGGIYQKVTVRAEIFWYMPCI